MEGPRQSARDCFSNQTDEGSSAANCGAWLVKVGDLVYAKQDLKNGFQVIGLVLEFKYNSCKVLWNSETNPIGWWKIWHLQLVIEK